MKALLSIAALFTPTASTLAVEWSARHGMSERDYQQAVSQRSTQGYALVHASAFPTSADEKFAAVWLKRAEPGWVARHDLSINAYQREAKKWTAAGYRLTCISGYESRGVAKYAAIWQKQAGPEWVARLGLTERGYQATYQRMSSQGYRLIYVDGYAVKGQDRYAGIWEKANGDIVARHRLTSDQYQAEFTKQANGGYRLAHVCGYTVGSTDYYAAIWDKQKLEWRAHHRMTHDSYQQTFKKYAAAGFRVHRVDGYQIDGHARYAAIWVQDNDAFAKPTALWASASKVVTTGRKDDRMKPIDDLMTSFMVEHNLPGGAIAVSQGGRIVHSRGYGYADTENQVAVKPDSLFRIASISKPITAVAIMQLAEQGKLKLDDKVLSHIRFKPAGNSKSIVDDRWNDITIRHLLQHTGGWDRDESFDAMFRSVAFAKELGVDPPAKPEHVIRVMLGRKLDFDPGARYAYSNFGYCLLGRVIEQLTGKSYEAYVKESVLKPLGVISMQIGATFAKGRQPNEVRYYHRSQGASVFAPSVGDLVPQPYGAWYLEAMDSHGGWIASATDLVKFATAFDDPANCKILKASSIEEMFARPPGRAGLNEDGTPSARFYSCGWSVRPVGSRANHWHTGSLPGTSTILVRRHDGLNWAVLFNSRQGKGSEAPASAIDSLMHKAVNEAIK